MKIENQVCTVEQSRKLIKSGIKPEAFLMWHIGGVTGEWVLINSIDSNISKEDLPAFTGTELGNMLPPCIQDNKHIPGYLHQIRDTKEFYLEYITNIKDAPENNYRYIILKGDTEADARAKMLIYLLENNLVDVEACNSRLAE